MACLGSVLYDPAVAATKATDTLLAMTALDTTNARIVFTAPANGAVLVRIRVAEKGATAQPMVLLGVLDGATVRGRQAPIVNRFSQGVATSLVTREATFLVTGLTAGTSYTWDAAYGVETVLASTALGWGGPNNATLNDAYGGLVFEVWETANLLAGKMYDPSTAATASTASALALTAIDTTNLRLTFTAPASGRVLVRLVCAANGAPGASLQIMLGALDGATVRGRQVAIGMVSNSTNTTDLTTYQSEFVVSGLTSGTVYTWDAAYGVETAQAAVIGWGGPDNATANDAYGGFAYEIWTA